MKRYSLTILFFLMGFINANATHPFFYPPELMRITGIMRCAPAVNFASDFYDMYGCNSLGGILTIEQFFDRYKRDKNDRIITIHYEASQNLIHIYYGRQAGFPLKEE